MSIFETRYFQKFNFSNKQIEKYFASAHKDIKIAERSRITDVKFLFTYNSFIKLGITLIASYGYKVKSRSGHHVKIIEQMSKILHDEDIEAVGNQMRKTRNTELYDGGIIITDKQTTSFFLFTKKLFPKINILIKKKLNKL